ncbi:uncharacterized protein FOMMEDRAFT_146460 [Fomitiporia mediterranea MF3/22]|uniref:uncharacterized protein n=1 Tax=Fomitiporia mediterranea (strain MF3/22) TaxID=694068 RepID=UPI000440815E|nr:uncharacterized protein FOMMEDRAFT_146460 [Fomitiporia mediterranea MF3/22]EJD04588.1 hypothetical protein FOMMEDRAFT_146460 [Fomitiporia mediterranea MF3/22]
MSSQQTTPDSGGYRTLATDRDESCSSDFDVDYQAILFVIDAFGDSAFTLSPGRRTTFPTDASPSHDSSIPKRRSFTLLSDSSSSDTAYQDSDSGLESDTETDVDDDIYDYEHIEEIKTEGNGDDGYSFQLLPAVTVPSFTTGPRSMDAPWPYTFEKGSTAFAKNANGTWHRVTLLDSGFLSSAGIRDSFLDLDTPSISENALMYTARWTDSSGRTCYGTFCPTRGDLKPDDAHVRRLLAKEGSLRN